MPYQDITFLKETAQELELYIQLQNEYGAQQLKEVVSNLKYDLEKYRDKIKNLDPDLKLQTQEPNELEAIKKLRPANRQKKPLPISKIDYQEKLKGALIGRMAACILGSAVEFWSIKRMQDWATEIGDQFPPIDYWSKIPNPKFLKYDMSRLDEYTRDKMDGVPVDDDIIYTLLGLLVVEEYGIDFTVEDIGKAWKKHLPYACTAEEIALENLHKNVPAIKCGSDNNPYREWIGAFIRADAWGYLAPGNPEKAAELAYKDAYISHRRNGIYGEMFFAAAISASFTVDDPIDALKIGLGEIPKNCSLTHAIQWALEISPTIKNYKDAREAVDIKFKGMNQVHTINNACLVVFGITIGGLDYTKVISEIVAMGMDNDCTAATVGSVVGAIIGFKNIPDYWYKNFNNKIHSYLINNKSFSIDDVLNRFTAKALL